MNYLFMLPFMKKKVINVEIAETVAKEKSRIDLNPFTVQELCKSCILSYSIRLIRKRLFDIL